VIGEGYLKKSAAPVRRWHQPVKPVTQTPNLQKETVISEPAPEVSTGKTKRQQPEHSIISMKEESGPEPSEKEPVASSSEAKTEVDTSLPAPERSAKAPPSSPPHQGKYTIQAGVFVDPGNSQSLVEDLKKQGYQARVKITESRGKKMHKVRLGSFDSRESAQKTAQDMKRQGYQVIIIPED